MIKILLLRWWWWWWRWWWWWWYQEWWWTPLLISARHFPVENGEVIVVGRDYICYLHFSGAHRVIQNLFKFCSIARYIDTLHSMKHWRYLQLANCAEVIIISATAAELAFIWKYPKMNDRVNDFSVILWSLYIHVSFIPPPPQAPTICPEAPALLIDFHEPWSFDPPPPLIEIPRMDEIFHFQCEEILYWLI